MRAPPLLEIRIPQMSAVSAAFRRRRRNVFDSSAEIQKTIEYGPAGSGPVVAKRVLTAGASTSPADAGTPTSGVDAAALSVIELSTRATGMTVSDRNHRASPVMPRRVRMVNHPDGFWIGVTLANVDRSVNG